MEKALNIVSKFNLSSEVKNVKPLGNGHINSTFLAELKDGSKYTVQAINGYVFKNPPEVMENISKVTEHIRKKLTQEGKTDVDRRALKVIFSKEGKPYYKDEEGKYWRMYSFIDNASTYDNANDPETLYNAGFGFGNFQNYIADIDVSGLFETIPDFHNTTKRFENLAKAIKEDKMGRADSCRDVIDFYMSRIDEMSMLVDMRKNGELPVRVTHNDTKFNNILIDDETKEALAVIDLDTVMPGLITDDFGDAIRFCSNTALEDETDLSKIHFDFERYKSFTDGFLTGINGNITNKEIECLPYSAKIITMEIGSRFLTDYLEGDVYFKIHHETHNLDRAINQATLAASMERHFGEMKDFVKKYMK